MSCMYGHALKDAHTSKYAHYTCMYLHVSAAPWPISADESRLCACLPVLAAPHWTTVWQGGGRKGHSQRVDLA